MKQIVRDYLTFNKRERNGVLVLVTIIASMIIYLNVSDNFQEKKKIDVTKFAREIDSLSLVELRDSGEDLGDRIVSVHKRTQEQKSFERFDFDPNHLSAENWKKLGLSKKQIRIIQNYESKGGKFRKKEDLKKMYCIKEAQYLSLEPFIKIVPVPPLFENGKVEKPAAPNAFTSKPVLELNTADSAVLTTVKGIGPFYAKAIIKYRNLLGGFCSKEQLLEVWKFDREKLNAVETFITVDPSLVRKININICEAEQLKSPYIKWNVANAIVNYRKQHGKFKTIDEIKNTDLVDDETLRKIAPYLSLE